MKVGVSTSRDPAKDGTASTGLDQAKKTQPGTKKDDTQSSVSNIIAIIAAAISAMSLIFTIIIQWKQSGDNKKSNAKSESIRAILVSQIEDLNLRTQTELKRIEKDIADTRIKAYVTAERQRRTHELIEYFDSPEMIECRVILWKAKGQILGCGNLQKFYDAITLDDLMSETVNGRLVLLNSRMTYFWHRVSVSDVDWDICRNQLGSLYANWYEKYYSPGMEGIHENTKEGWDRFLQDHKVLRENLLQSDSADSKRQS